MTWLWGVLLASVAGSVHCGAMCGAFVCAYARGPGAGHADSAWPHVAYNGGRLVSYALLGAIAGALGARVDQIGAFVGVGRAAAIVAGAAMAVWALNEIATVLGARWSVAGVSMDWAKRMLGGALLRIRGASPIRRAAVLGLLTTLLPCGWLAAFVATAAATGSAAGGVAVMVVFWVGTLPMLVGFGFSVHRFGGSFARRLPLAAATIVLALGVLSIAGRLRPPQPIRHHSTSEAPRVGR